MLDKMTWMDVERYLKEDDRLVFVTGSCEQHGYLSLASDAIVPTAIAREACEREKVLLAPTLNYGVCPYFTAYPGTFSLRAETFTLIVRELIEGALAQGFRRILVSNGHGGNTGLLIPLLIEVGNAHPEAKLVLFHWWRHPMVVRVAQEAGLPQLHGNWTENFPINRVGPVPKGSKEIPMIPTTATAAATRQLLGDGSFGGPYAVPKKLSDRLYSAAVEAMVAEIRAL